MNKENCALKLVDEIILKVLSESFNGSGWYKFWNRSENLRKIGHNVHTHKEKALAKHYNLLGPKASESLIKTFQTKFQVDY